MSPEATRGHTLSVTLDRSGFALTPVCHEPDGAVCRVTCVAGCESYGYPECQHGPLTSVGYCNAVEWLINSDVDQAYGEDESIPLCDGMAIEVEWDPSVGYTWTRAKPGAGA